MDITDDLLTAPAHALATTEQYLGVLDGFPTKCPPGELAIGAPTSSRGTLHRVRPRLRHRLLAVALVPISGCDLSIGGDPGTVFRIENLAGFHTRSNS